MAIVNIKIFGKNYPVSCADNQESHLMQLNDAIQEKLDELNIKGSEILKLVILLLKMEDEIDMKTKLLEESKLQIESLNNEVKNNNIGNDSSSIVRSIIDVAKVLEGINTKIEDNKNCV